MQETFTGKKFKLLNSEETGIILEFISLSPENIEEFLISYDNKTKIDRITQQQIHLGEKVSKSEFFSRLIRDIQSPYQETREIASTILCDFLEFDIEEFDFRFLKSGIEKIIEQIIVEENINVEHKLVEGLFEFVWHKNLSKKAEIELLEKLTEIDKYYVWSYLGDEIFEDIKSYNSKKLNEYYSKNIEKWKEKDIQMYGKEKMLEYYKNLNK